VINSQLLWLPALRWGEFNALLEQGMIRKWANCFLIAAAMTPALAGAERYNRQIPQSIIAREIYDPHTLIMWIIVGIFVVVFGAMIYSIIKHRKAAGHKSAQFHENVMVEIAWTIVPFLILIGMAYPATKTVISMKDTSSPDMTIKATGYLKVGLRLSAGGNQLLQQPRDAARADRS